MMPESDNLLKHYDQLILMALEQYFDTKRRKRNQLIAMLMA